MIRAVLLFATFVFLTAYARPAKASPLGWPEGPDPGVVFQQLPNRHGGPPSDLSYHVQPLPPAWQQVAEDVVLSESAVIMQFRWWGFYHLDNPPTSGEEFRLRIYAPRTGDNLPDDMNILYEESFTDPPRSMTGFRVITGVDPYEYLYTVILTTPFSMDAGALYWWEVVQLNDIATAFRWESGDDPIGVLSINGTFVPGGDWQLFQNESVAMQLSTIPEQSSLLMILLSLIPWRRRYEPRRRP